MAAAFQAPYQSMAQDYLTFRTVNAKRKSAVEILQETKSLFVKSEAVLDAEQRLVKAAKCDRDGVNERVATRDRSSAKVRKKVLSAPARAGSDQLQTKLRRLLNSSSKENVADSDEGDVDSVDGKSTKSTDLSIGQAIDHFALGFHRAETDIQYQSLPDLSASSRDSLSQATQQAMSDDMKSNYLRQDEEMNISTNSDTSIDDSMDSSDKSYGKPPSLPKSLQSMGGSFGKVEERLTTWKEPVHCKLVRCKSSGVDDRPNSPPTKLPHQPPLPSGLNEFFQHLGLSSHKYNSHRRAFGPHVESSSGLQQSKPKNELTVNDSGSCSPVFFSSQGSTDSTDLISCRGQRSQRSTSPPAPPPVSVVQTNARVVKWLCKTSQWL